MSVVPIDLEAVEICNLYVPPEKRGNGFGRLLLDLAIGYARACGFRRLQLHVNSSNEVARRIYEEVGFQIVDEELHLEREL